MSPSRCPHCDAPRPAEAGTADAPARCPRCGRDLPPAPAPATPTGPGWGPQPTTEAMPGAATVIVPSFIEPSEFSLNLPDSFPPPAPAENWPAIPGYELLGRLGAGGMGVVYRARQVKLDRVVAVKTVAVGQAPNPQALSRFEKEALTIARLQHPNIVTAFDFGQHEASLYLVMELVNGEDLETHVERGGPQGEAFTWGVIRQAAAGLAHAARLGIVHRDVKPANLILTEPPAGLPLPPGLPLVKVTDFGLALLGGAAPAAPRLTVVGTTIGTPAYMAPEQFTNSAVDARADIYALGVTAFHLLTGRHPFAGQTIWEIMSAKHQGETCPLEPLAGRASAASVELIAAMTAHDPARRPAGYDDLLARIDRVLAPPPGTSPATVTATVPVALQPSRRQWLALLALPAVAWAVWVALRSRRPRPTLPTLVSAGRSQILFDGEHLPLTVWSFTGSWQAGMDDEGGRALVGRGVARCRLLPPANFRLTFGVKLNQASAVDVLFAIGQAPDVPAYVLRVTPTEAVLGERAGEAGEPRPLVRLPLREAAEDSSGYREVRVERHGPTWWAFVDGRSVGHAPVRGTPERPEFRLATDGGPAFFEHLELDELVRPGP